MSDLISRQAAIDAVSRGCQEFRGIFAECEKNLNALPSAQPTQPNASNALKTLDCIDRQAAIDAICAVCGNDCDKSEFVYNAPQDEQVILCPEHYCLCTLPSAQPEPLSDAYTKAVWTWLLDYQIKAAKLKGRYTPYEVLSWVANDWRKEHEGSD